MKMLPVNQAMILSIFVIVVLIGGMSGVSYGNVCQVGDVLSPGESCTYPGTDIEFSVLANGSGRFLFFTAGTGINARNVTINGVKYNFAASKRADGKWEIEAVPGGGDPQTPIEEPDLVVTSVSSSDTSVSSGERFTLSATVRNQGTGESTATTLRYYRSTNNSISANDTAVGSDSVSGLRANRTSNENVSLTAPTTPGTYYYGVCVDSVTDESDTANNCSIAVRVTVTAPPRDADNVNGGGVVDRTETEARRTFESSTPLEYTRVTLSNDGRVWGISTKYTTDSNVSKVTYILLAKLKGCAFAAAELSRQSKVYIKTQPLGSLNNYQSESVCGTSSSQWPSSWNGVRITHLRFFDSSSPSNINEATYNSSTGQYKLTSATSTNQTEPTRLKADVNADGTVNIADLVLVASNLGKTGQNPADVNGDGQVNIADLVLVAGALGNAAAAPALHPDALEMLTSADVRLWLSEAQHLRHTDATAHRGVLFLEHLLAALIPKETALLANYPNPFNPETWIPYQLAKDAEVTLTIYGVNGHVVRRLGLGHQPAGVYESRSRAVYWDGKNAIGEPVASGLYFYTLTAGTFTATRKMLIRK